MNRGSQAMENTGLKNCKHSLAGILALFLLLTIASISTSPYIQAGDPGGRYSNVWLDPEGKPLPFETFEEVEVFLETAQVAAMKDIPVGITRPRKMLLQKDGLRMHAIFRDVDEFKRNWKGPKGPRLNFHDSCMHEYAAYRFARLLGLDRVPPVVIREFKKEDFIDPKVNGKLRKKKGTLQAWVENAMSEKDRRARNIIPPDIVSWGRQSQLMHIFDNLIFNEDRNQGNVLIGPDWKIWFIDSTRAFMPYPGLSEPDTIKKCDRRLWAALQRLDEERVKKELGEVLTPRPLRCLIKRVDALILHLQRLIEERGEHMVIVNAEI